MTHRILVVENDAITRFEVAEALQSLGYLVEVAGDGSEALERLNARAIKPGLILMDLRTPRMNGWDLVRALASDGELATIPFVLVSGDPDLASHARRLGAAGYLRKPFGLDALVEKITALAPP